MCKHRFEYLADKRENYNPDGKTLTGICKYCGAKQKSYGMRWAIPVEESFFEESFFKEIPYGESRFDYIDKSKIVC